MIKQLSKAELIQLQQQAEYNFQLQVDLIKTTFSGITGKIDSIANTSNDLTADIIDIYVQKSLASMYLLDHINFLLLKCNQRSRIPKDKLLQFKKTLKTYLHKSSKLPTSFMKKALVVKIGRDYQNTSNKVKASTIEYIFEKHKYYKKELYPDHIKKPILKTLLEIVDIKRVTYNKAVKSSKLPDKDEFLYSPVKEIFYRFHQTRGIRTIRKYLIIDYNIATSHKRISRVMRHLGLKCTLDFT